MKFAAAFLVIVATQSALGALSTPRRHQSALARAQAELLQDGDDEFDFGDEDDCDILLEGVSEQCAIDESEWCRDDAFFEAYFDFIDENYDGCIDEPIEATPCDVGVEDFAPICAAQGGRLCFVSIGDAIERLSEDLKHAAAPSYDCLPASCNDDDILTYFGLDGFAEVLREEVQLELGVEELDFEIEFSATCDN